MVCMIECMMGPVSVQVVIVQHRGDVLKQRDILFDILF
jgi:hypothetical protein